MKRYAICLFLASLCCLPAVATVAPSPDDYHAWTAYPSAHYPLVVYSQEKLVPKEILFRAEVAMRGFEQDYPGFHFNLKAPIEVPVSWDARRRFAGSDGKGPVVVPVTVTDKIVGRADQSSLNEATGAIMEKALQASTRNALPEWFYSFMAVDQGEPSVQTGAKPVFILNPASLSKMIQNGHFRDFAELAKPFQADRKALFDDDPSDAVWLSSCMYVLYAREAPGGEKLRSELTQVLTEAGQESPQQVQDSMKTLQEKLSALATPLQDYWKSISPEQYVLAHHLEATVRLWASLAAYADAAGTHYASFAGLKAAVDGRKITLPPNVPATLVSEARMFLDRDGYYELGWDGSTAVVREVAPEGFGFTVRATAKDGLVDENLTRFTATVKDLAHLPAPDTNPYHSDHYLLITDSEPGHASDILLQGDLYHKRLVAELPWSQPAKTARLVMYYYSDAWNSGLSNTNFYQPLIGVTFVSPLGDDTMRHEMTHQVVDFSSTGRFPWWFNEAIAEYYGRHIAYAGDAFVGPFPLADEVKGLQSYLAGNWPGRWGKLTIPQLVHLDPEGWDSYKHGGYTLSWSWVYYLINGDNGAHRDLFDNYMKAVAANTDDAHARDAAFDDAVLKLEPQWRAYWTAASQYANEKFNREAFVRVAYLAREEALRQGFTKVETNLGLLPSLISQGKLKPSAHRADRVTSGALDSFSRSWLWTYKWTVTGTGDGVHLACEYPDGTRVETWRDPGSKLMVSSSVLSQHARERETASTMPPHKDPVKLADNAGNQASPAQKPWLPVGNAGTAAYPPSKPSAANGVPSYPPSKPVPTVSGGATPPPNPAGAAGAGVVPPPKPSLPVTAPAPPPSTPSVKDSSTPAAAAPSGPPLL